MNGTSIERRLNAFAVFFFIFSILSVASFYIWRKFYFYPFSSRSLLLTVSVLALVVCLALGRKRRVPAFLVVFSSMMGLFVLNALVEVFVSRDAIAKLPPPPGFDTRSKFEVIQAFRDQGIDAVPHMCAFHVYGAGSGQTLLPLSGISNKRAVFCNESGTRAFFRTDKHGFNNPDTIYDADGADLMLLGDSFVDGGCVPEGFDLGSWLRRAGQSVANMGCGGNGPLAMLATWAEYSKLVRPRIVVWLYFEGNDLFNLSEERNTLLINYMDEGYSQNLARRIEEKDSLMTGVMQKRKDAYLRETRQLEKGRSKDWKLALFNVATLYHLRQIFGLTSIGVILKQFETVFLEFKKRVEREDQQILFVYLPKFSTIRAKGRRPLFPNAYEDFRIDILEFVGSTNVGVLDFEEVMLSQEDPLSYFPFRKLGHYNPEGYELLAKSITAAVKDLRRPMAP